LGVVELLGLLEFIEFVELLGPSEIGYAFHGINLLGLLGMLDSPELGVRGLLDLRLEVNCKCFGGGSYLVGLLENHYINEGIPTDLKKDCTATIPLVLRIPSGYYKC
jgi:hypothetical protein